MARSIVKNPQKAISRSNLSQMGKALLLTAGIVMISAQLSSCSLFKEDIVVPTYDTPREQALNAELQYERARRAVEDDQKQDELEKAEAALKTTISRFPDDREYIPAAAALLGKVYLLMEEPKKAEASYQSVIRSYSDLPDIHAEALFGMAEALGDQERFAEEKEYYGQLIEQYKTSADPRIQQRVAIATRRYAEVERAN